MCSTAGQQCVFPFTYKGKTLNLLTCSIYCLYPESTLKICLFWDIHYPLPAMNNRSEHAHFFVSVFLSVLMKKVWGLYCIVLSYNCCGSGSARTRVILASWIRIRIRVKSWITDPHRSQNSGAVEAQNGAMKGCGRSQMEAWRVSRPVVANSRHTDEQDLDLHSY
jgi:hypothetical protein